MSYLYGSLFHSEHRVHALKILAVDFDRGIIGQSLSAAYKELEGGSFPELQFHDSMEYPTVTDIRRAVCRGHYWGAVFVQNGASARLEDALSGGIAASNYNASNTVTYIWNEARYAVVSVGDVSGNLETLIGATTSVFHALNGTGATQYVNQSDPNAVQALLNPIVSSNINIMPTTQGTRPLYNTVTIVLPILMQFFYLMALNGIHAQFGIYERLQTSRIAIFRFALSVGYTFVASLTVAGYIWAFRSGWAVSSAQFVLTWLTYWLFMHINFLVMDIVTAYIPTSFLSFAVLTWIIISVTGTIYPLDLNPGFYRWHYALPSYETYQILIQVWTGGCNDQLHRALPILFAWEIVALVGAFSGMLKRNTLARNELVTSKEAEADEAMKLYTGGTR